ncbi:hypothetical protein SAMN05443572_11082 [Myxococcus fulvus]|uniref:Uncharacterized protein n=1 Tax=Myxococcus fulvus TaxID=33 RepID=A0A511T816_MYXFU|nr:hypothetical protein [Myxococcus fulvus]GEN10316.1 hypothetical protein MFU01_53530 [Myxococcus fulvus]SEU34571.1 hypothetical protein SAMN05443572_11082 [Myxococcus fulvus]
MTRKTNPGDAPQARRGAGAGQALSAPHRAEKRWKAGDAIKDRLPTREQTRARADQLRAWTRRTVREHPLGLGLGALALGFLSASLLPSTQAEQRAYGRAAGRMRKLADELEQSGQLDEALSSLRRAAVTTATEPWTGGDTRDDPVPAPGPRGHAPGRGGRRRG